MFNLVNSKIVTKYHQILLFICTTIELSFVIWPKWWSCTELHLSIIYYPVTFDGHFSCETNFLKKRFSNEIWGSKAKVNFAYDYTMQSSRKFYQLCMSFFIPSIILNVVIGFIFICLIWEQLIIFSFPFFGYNEIELHLINWPEFLWITYLYLCLIFY